MKAAYSLTFSLFLMLGSLQAQQHEPIINVIQLDSFVVTASRTNFDVEDFIDLVRKDESFYQAFQNLRWLSYQSDNDIALYHKSGKQLARYKAKIQQNEKSGCRTMEILEEKIEGNYFKKKRKLRYYTAELFDRLFFTHGEVCQTASSTDNAPKGMNKHIEQLKRLIFQPGEAVEVPFIGGKTAIFEEDMIPYYNYSIQSKIYDNKIDSYVFSAQVKPDAKDSKTIIKSLETYFDKKTFQVIARNYRLQYEGAAFDFDVTMNIRLRKLGKIYVPQSLNYDGFWKVATRKAEISKFSANFYAFE